VKRVSCLLPGRRLAGKKKCVLFVNPINPKSVTYVPVRLLPFSPVQTPPLGGEGISGKNSWQTLSYELAVKRQWNIYVILNGAKRSEESRRLKNEILRWAQNDKQ
jgi:hypothetical protein